MTLPYQVHEIKAFVENPFKKYAILRGAGGTGKTFTISKFLEHFGYKHSDYVFLGPTGKSVSVAEEKGMHGSTIHRWFGIQNNNSKQRIDRFISSKYRSHDHYILTLKTKLGDAKFVFIDEISMVNNDIMNHIMNTLNEINPNLKIFLAGDYHQLPTVIIAGNEDHKKLKSSIGIIQNLIKTNRAVTIDFITRYRSTNEDFNQFLYELRSGFIDNAHDVSTLIQHFCNVYTDDTAIQNINHLTFLFNSNAQVDETNQRLLAELPGQTYTNKADVKQFKFPAGSEFEAYQILDQFQMDMTVEFKVGAKILFRVNNPNGSFRNGDEGIIQSVRPKSVMVSKLTPHGSQLIEVGKHTYQTSDINKEDGFIIEAEQWPFSLGTARTIHKSQGDEFLNLHLDFQFFNHTSKSSEMKWQLFYVAISRIKDPSKVWINERCIQALEKQYTLFSKGIKYDKLGLLYNHPAIDYQEYLRRD